MAGSPSYFPEGNTVLPNDTLWRTWQKICGKEFDNHPSAAPSLAPKQTDTIAVLKRKVDYILAGTTSTF